VNAHSLFPFFPSDGLASDTPADLAGYLRGKTPEEIFGGYAVWTGGMLGGFTSVFTGGAVIREEGPVALNNPKTYNQVPTILGSNKEEFKLFMLGSYGIMPDADYQAAAMAGNGDMAKSHGG
jgi:hypothetical protein